jgi:hypothetical protein
LLFPMTDSGKIRLKIILVICFSVVVAVGSGRREARSDSTARDEPAKECTIFTLHSGKKVFFCGNLDHPNPDGHIWFWPASKEGYGGLLHGYTAKAGDRTWIGYEGGLNEKGLAFDTNGLPTAEMNPHPERNSSWESDNFWQRMLKKCSNVNEAIEMAKDFDFGETMNFQVHAADSSGDAVVISPGTDGELSFTRKERGEGFLVSTNFNNANPEHRHGPYPCNRYETAVNMLKKIDRGSGLNVDYLSSILDAVHFEGASYNTIYSYICDLREGKFYLFHFHQFDEAAVFDLQKELANGERTSKTGDLVSWKTKDQASEEYEAYRRKQKS